MLNSMPLPEYLNHSQCFILDIAIIWIYWHFLGPQWCRNNKSLLYSHYQSLYRTWKIWMETNSGKGARVPFHISLGACFPVQVYQFRSQYSSCLSEMVPWFSKLESRKRDRRQDGMMSATMGLYSNLGLHTECQIIYFDFPLPRLEKYKGILIQGLSTTATSNRFTSWKVLNIRM